MNLNSTTPNIFMKTQKPTARSSRKATDESSLFLANQLCFAIYSTSLAMTKLYRPLLSALGLTYPQYVVLLALWEQTREKIQEQNHLTVSALGEKVSLDSGTLTPLLKRLQTQGLIIRARGADDERKVHIKLTREGLALKKTAEAIQEQIACATDCSKSDARALARALQKLRASLLANQPA